MNKINIGIIGTGRIGRIHAKNLKYLIPGSKVLAVSDIMLDSAKEVAQELEIPICVQDYKEILKNKDINAVVICSSTDTHAQIMIEAAEAGKDIFCEKPIALDMDTINKALDSVKKAKVKLMLGFNRRFDPSFKKAKEMVEQGKIGKPHFVRISSRDPEPPPAKYVAVSGGLFLDMMIHDFDMARYLLGEDVVELIATGNCLIDPEIGKQGDIDTAAVLLKYKSGALGTIDNSRKAIYGYDQRIEIFGSEGCIVVGNKTPTEVTLNRQDSVYNEKPLYFFLERYQESYLAEMKHFIECIINNKQPSVGGNDGKMSVVMGYAAKESLKNNAYVKIKQ